MDREETKTMLDILQVSYPKYYKDMGKQDMKDTIDLYFNFFGGYEIILVLSALKNYIKTNQYPPSIAGITEQINLLLPQTMFSTDHWNLLLKAVRNSLYNSKEEFDKLPPECQRYVGDSMGLKELGMIDSSVLNTVVHGQFLKVMPTIMEQTNVTLGMNPELKRLISGNIVKELK